LELIIKDKNFYDSGRNINNLLNVTNDKSSDFSRFKSLYKKVFETNNKFKLETHDEKDDKYLLIINEFYNKYADLVSREYSNILQNDLRTPFPISYNSSDKKVYDAKELSIQYMDSFFDKFRHFFIKKLVKKYSPLNNLPIPKGSLTIGKHKITTS
jgi:hypothetical protein